MAPKMPQKLKAALEEISKKSTSPGALRDNVNIVFTYLYKLPEKKPTEDSLSDAQQGFTEVTGLQPATVDKKKTNLNSALSKAKKDAIDEDQLSGIRVQLNKFKGYISENLFNQVDNTFATKIKMMKQSKDTTTSDSLPEATSDDVDLSVLSKGDNPDNKSNAQDGEIEKNLENLISSLGNTTDNVSIMNRLKDIYAKYIELIKHLTSASALARVAEDERFRAADFKGILDKAVDDVVTDLDLAAIYAVKKVWDPFAQHIKGHSNTTENQIKKFNESIKKVEKDFNSIEKNLDLFAKGNDRFRIGVNHGSSLRVYARNSVKVSDVIGFLAKEPAGYSVKFKDNHYVGTKKDKKKCFIANNGELSVDVKNNGKYCYIPKKKPLEILSDETVGAKNVGKDYVIEKIGCKLFDTADKNAAFAELGGRPAKDRFLADF